MMTAPVILSPHFDDAVFNCWHMVNQPGAIVMTIFAGVPTRHQTALWDRLCGQPSSPQMMINRRSENENALAGTGVQIINLNFLEAQYRKTSVGAAQLADAIIENSPSNALYMAPLAGSIVWRHGDHVLVREAALELVQRDRRVMFYPDVPYMRLPQRLATRHIRRLSARASDVLRCQAIAHPHALSPVLLQSKQQAMRAYTSQWSMTNLVSLGGLSRQSRCAYEVVFELEDTTKAASR